jgi:hypothetical protein
LRESADALYGRPVDPQGVTLLKEVSRALDGGWDWVWMTFMMGFWLIVFGAVVYVAVRLGQRPLRKDH